MKSLMCCCLVSCVAAIGGCSVTEECTDGNAACCSGDKTAAAGECCKEGASAAASTAAPLAAAVNATCPISGETLPANATLVAFNGQNVGLCCAGCSTEWAGLSEARKSADLAKSMAQK